MSANLILVIVVGVMVGSGVTLVLERSLTRILIGFVLIGNGLNVLFLVASGPAGRAPLIGVGEGRMSDPLPQAMALTAIVITLGVTAFGLALAYRAYQLTGTDDVQDDLEDDFIRRRAERDEVSTTFDEAMPDEAMPDEDYVDDDNLDVGVAADAESSAGEENRR
ncbi:Na(+)/H(+) antiporter subunit C [uncultured Aeromicrobium sp.]|uniref:Na(+)/H(+) antiporter subunit C n=1 Tax=uncultured Aeromicrobium sp. TaxID=337820 RepID=UPI0025E11171|nr:Na(+)/H(+) antiporter subunit C [uncultured Aeromicrobium sp.]